MYVKKVVLENYRNYEKASVELHSGLNVFFGDNAQGKTNFIESIYLCGVGRSHRTFKDKEIISWNKEWAYIKADIERNTARSSIEINLLSDKPKIVKVGGMRISKLAELLGNLNVVMFSPEDLKIVKDAPSFRRKFMDIEISQIKPAYYYNLHEYNKILLQRNNLLKSIRYDRSLMNTLDIWDEQLSQFGSHIINYRAEFVNKLSILSKLIHRKITDGKEKLNVSYSTQFSNIKEIKDIKNAMYNELIKNRQKDLQRAITSIGPHRDDIDFFINDIDVKNFGSQGQQRTCALSIKLSEIELVKGECGEYPVLLLDDVLSELDKTRQKYLLESLKNVQTIITCTSLADIIDFRRDDRFLYEVKGGIVNKMKK